MMHRGHIRLWRQIEDTSFYQNSHAFHLFIHLLLKANWKDKKIMFNGAEITIKRGSLIFGRKKASEDLGIAGGTIYDNIKLLVKAGSITIKTNNKFSIITIANYNKFNPIKDDTQQPANNQPTTSQQPANTSKELKNVRSKELRSVISKELDTNNDNETHTEKEIIRQLLPIYKLISPIQCENVGLLTSFRRECRTLLAKGKTFEEIKKAIESAPVESKPWEIMKKDGKHGAGKYSLDKIFPEVRNK